MAELELTVLRHGADGDAPLLRLEGLTVRVGIRRVIEGLDLELGGEDVVRVSGPNGTGKSTLLNAIAGLEPARVEAGRVIFAGEEITSLPTHERARRGLRYLRQRGNVFLDLTVEENLRFAAGSGGPGAAEAGLALLRERYPGGLGNLPLAKRAMLLSGGERQRLAWAMATLLPCRLLLADEPEAGLSTPLELPERGAVLLVSHQNAFENATGGAP